MGSVKKAFKKVVHYANPINAIKDVSNKLTGADKQKKALEEYKQALESSKNYDPSKPLEGTDSIDQSAGGAREDLEQSMQQGSGGNVGSVISSDSRASYFKQKNRKRGIGSVNF